MAQNNTKLLDKIEICLQKVNDAQLSYDKKFEMLAEENAALKFKVMTQQNDTTEKLDETSNDHSIWILVLIILNITLLVILTIVLVFLLQSKKSSTPENHKTTDASNYEEITQKQISDPIYASADYTHTINDSFYDVQEEYEVIRETECDENIYSASADSDDFYLQTNVIEVHRPDCVEGDADIYAERIKKCRKSSENNVETRLEDLTNLSTSIFSKIDELSTKLDKIIDPKEKDNSNSAVLSLVDEIRGNVNAFLNKIDQKVTNIDKNINNFKSKVNKVNNLNQTIANLNKTLNLSLINKDSIDSLQNKVNNLSADINLHKADLNHLLQNINHSSSSLESTIKNLISKDEFSNRINQSDDFLSELITQSANSTKFAQNNSSERVFITFLVILNVILSIFLIMSIIYIKRLSNNLKKQVKINQESPKYAKISKNRNYSFSKTNNASQPQWIYESATLPSVDYEPVYESTLDEDPIHEMEELRNYSGHYEEQAIETDMRHEFMHESSHCGESSNAEQQNAVDRSLNDQLDEDLYAEVVLQSNASVEEDNSQIYAVVMEEMMLLKEELRTTQNLIKTEKIESNALFYYNNPNKMLDLTDEMQEKMNNLNESFSKNIEDLTGQIDRIKRDANTTLEEIKNIIDQMSNNQVNLSYELTNISKKIIQDLDKSAYNQNQIPQNREVKSEIQETNTKLALLEAQINQITKHTYQESININQKLQNSHESPNSTISEITEYINTILLIIIIAVLIVLIFRDRNKSSTSRNAPIQSSLSQTTTNTQLDVDSSSSVPRNRDFEDNQTYESAQRNNIEQSTGFMPNDVPEYGLKNEMYGKACNEDLYSEVISPKRGQNKDNIDDCADIYAVVYKPERD
ncbi:unnamed protein product [Chironomus riparius]|uniref:Uncharacterized protein n=1 Tax=Chironomus riparius TaxID=315576 RepID=A0A9N9S6D7_9DIPT|nr:unnamed protein product [Chironomus riparius]